MRATLGLRKERGARLDLDVVGMDGVISPGEIAQGDNPVYVTFELVIEAIER